MNEIKLSDKQLSILEKNISSEYIDSFNDYEEVSDFINLIIQLKNKNLWYPYVLKEVEFSIDEKNKVIKECNKLANRISSFTDSSFDLDKKYQLIDGSKTYYKLSQIIDSPKVSYFLINSHYTTDVNLYDDLLDVGVKSLHKLLIFMRNQIK